jgi:pilus assembly protein Flp/PilA
MEKHMRRFHQWVSEFVQREDGPTAVEYAVMLALIIVVCIAAITTLGQNADNTFITVGNAIGSTGS